MKLGRYSWVDDNITPKNFPTERKGTAEVVVELVHFDHLLSSKEVLQRLNYIGFRPAELPELLVFGEKYPNVCQEFPVVALGSVWQNWLGRRYVPYIKRVKGTLELPMIKHIEEGSLIFFHPFGLEWVREYRFAAVRVAERRVEFKVWKTIKLGTGLKTADDFLCALKDGGFRLGKGGSDIICNPAFTVNPRGTEIELVRVTVAELVIKYGTTRMDICEQAIQLGLELCPAEVGPQLRLQYKNQPRGEQLSIGMEPITNSDGELSVFQVEHLGFLDLGPTGLWLVGLSLEKYKHSGNELWVFARRKFFGYDGVMDKPQCMVEGRDKFKVWKTIKLGTGLRTANDFRKALKSKRFHIDVFVDHFLLDKMPISKMEAQIDLIVMTVAELGFKEGATQKDICEQAIQLGLELCPAEVGPQLRLQYKNQPRGEQLYVAMEPIALVFKISHDFDGRRLLDSIPGNPDYFLDADVRCVFVLPHN